MLIDEPPPTGTDVRSSLLLAGRLVEFRFRRRRRRSIGLTVNGHGLTVSAPLRAPWRDIEAFARQHAHWVVARLDQWAAAGRPRPLVGASGEVLPVAGENVVLEVRAGMRAVELVDGRLVVSLRRPERSGAVRELLVRWLKTRTLQALAPRAAHYAARIGRGAPAIAISGARTRWGVCVWPGRIRLSWRLAHLAPELADYVVAHEVAHLVELNHSQRFWRIVESLYPDWRTARRSIRLAAAALPIL